MLRPKVAQLKCIVCQNLLLAIFWPVPLRGFNVNTDRILIRSQHSLECKDPRRQCFSDVSLIFDPKNGFPGQDSSWKISVTFGDPSCIEFWDIVWKTRRRQGEVKTLPLQLLWAWVTISLLVLWNSRQVQIVIKIEKYAQSTHVLEDHWRTEWVKVLCSSWNKNRSFQRCSSQLLT